MTSKDENLSMEEETRDAALQTLAVGKLIKDAVKKVIDPEMDGAKTWLAEHGLEPGDRKTMRVAGVDAGTVSRTNPEPKPSIRVTDERAYAKWLEDHGHEVTWKVHLADHLTAPRQLEALVATGEVPDGVEVTETVRDSYLVVRQTAKQARALADRLGEASDLIAGMLTGYLEIEGSESA
ncbi:hypothetical protein [Actinobaculum sp. 352]|uniref:hypothetical protein n=1 Tax=Actinobaculum sp. 352 TaxID=2490946 RepID=UPI000F7F9E91|nr:hypothetical protein [Actinobaculum sp. 352]RTE47921.1 hypothetical protein EKN07_11725 [Actinobaculum sp. 352]